MSEVAEIFDPVQSTLRIAQANEAKRASGAYRGRFCLFQDKAFNVAEHLKMKLRWDALQIGVDMLNGAHCA